MVTNAAETFGPFDSKTWLGPEFPTSDSMLCDRLFNPVGMGREVQILDHGIEVARGEIVAISLGKRQYIRWPSGKIALYQDTTRFTVRTHSGDHRVVYWGQLRRL